MTFKWIDRKTAIEKAALLVKNLGIPVDGASIGIINNTKYAVNPQKIAPNQLRNFKSAIEKCVKEKTK